MIPKDSHAYEALNQVSRAVDYEMLISRPGISEPDSNFIWASTFKAPVGISFIRDEIYFNLLLPKGSENETDKKIFLNRVGARYKDELWQVRRSMDQMDNMYGPSLKLAVSALDSVVLDYAYIEKGRTYAHLVFNSTELPKISHGLLSLGNQEGGMRVEYLRKASGETSVFDVIDEHEEVSAVTIEAEELSGGYHAGKVATYFILSNILDSGLRIVGTAGNPGVSDLLKPSGTVSVDDSTVSFTSNNQLLMDMVEMMAEEYIVVYGSYGKADGSTLSLTINIPSKQTPSLLKVLSQIVEKSEGWRITMKEVLRFSGQTGS